MKKHWKGYKILKEKIKLIICFIVYLLAAIGISYTVLIADTFSPIVNVLIYASSLCMCSLSIIYIVKTKILFWVGIAGIIIGMIGLILSILNQQSVIILCILSILFISMVNLICGFILKDI